MAALTALSLEPADLAAAVPPWELAVGPEDVGVAVVAGTADDWDTAARAAGAAAELAGAPVVTVAVRPEDRPSSAAAALIAACDVVAAPAEVDALVERIARAGPPALVAAQLLRGGASLLTESFAYSMLLRGREFIRWRADHPVREGRAEAGAARVAVQVLPEAWVLRLTRPRRHNAFDARMREELCDALDAAATSAPAVVLLGEGPSFCAGGDLDEFGRAPDPVDAHLVRTGRSVARRLARLGDRLVVGVHGHCVGAGLELAACAPVVLAAPDTSIALPELTLGLNLGAGGAVSIPRRIGRHRTLELLLRDAPIDARTALEWGLVDALVASEDLERRCLEAAASPSSRRH
jgi:enoyl-CoA hydratase/carnithine racemase